MKPKTSELPTRNRLHRRDEDENERAWTKNRLHKENEGGFGSSSVVKRAS
ncbi:hypothetical protein J2S19_002443 [Metabacillus malikii]|uniref:Uncharacterized protein n=1 Tax=Metabacillus malikii TaxID=1504265 RepID=A0ABT9ZFZ1_9BACI|nr:hypothetical protein [Metabacillus malikii]